jgi:hypothetical protein
MDKILEKHLAAVLLLPKQEEEDLSIPETSKNIIPYSFYENDGNYNYIKTSSTSLVTETIGYWKNKPIFLYQDEKYVVLEKSKALVKLESLRITNDQIQKQKEEDEDKIKPIFKKIPKKESEDAEDKKPQNISNEIIQNYKNKKPSTQETQISDEASEKDNLNDTTVNSYIKKLKDDEGSKSKESTKASDDFTEILQKNADHPALKNLFKNQLEQSKKELYSLNEKFAQQHLARVLESGGGTNSVQRYKSVHTIGSDTETDITVRHNIGTKELVITLYQNDEMILAGIKHINENEFVVSFTEPQQNVMVVIFG